MSLPTLDVSKYTGGTAEEQRQLGQALLASLQSHGFVKLVNHGLDNEVIDEIMQWSDRFFRLDQSTKESIVNQKGLNPQRGYSGVGGENLKGFSLDGTGQQFVDVKEHFDQGPCDDRAFPNQWPPESSSNGLIGFRAFMEGYFENLSTLGLEILGVLEKALKVPSGTLTSLCSRKHNELRLNHYPSTTIEDIKEGRVRRSGAHTDYGVLTFLVQDLNGGLEIQDRSAIPEVKFLPVPAENKYALVVNVADTLHRWTNGLLPAGLHQVTIPGGRRDESTGKLPERFSIAFFMKGNREESLGSLSEFVSEKRPAEFEHITAIDYHKQRHAVLYT